MLAAGSWGLERAPLPALFRVVLCAGLDEAERRRRRRRRRERRLGLPLGASGLASLVRGLSPAVAAAGDLPRRGRRRLRRRFGLAGSACVGASGTGAFPPVSHLRGFQRFATTDGASTVALSVGGSTTPSSFVTGPPAFGSAGRSLLGAAGRAVLRLPLRRWPLRRLRYFARDSPGSTGLGSPSGGPESASFRPAAAAVSPLPVPTCALGPRPDLRLRCRRLLRRLGREGRGVPGLGVPASSPLPSAEATAPAEGCDPSSPAVGPEGGSTSLTYRNASRCRPKSTNADCIPGSTRVTRPL